MLRWARATRFHEGTALFVSPKHAVSGRVVGEVKPEHEEGRTDEHPGGRGTSEQEVRERKRPLSEDGAVLTQDPPSPRGLPVGVAADLGRAHQWHTVPRGGVCAVEVGAGRLVGAGGRFEVPDPISLAIGVSELDELQHVLALAGGIARIGKG
eukprot:scaffold118735_cov29-Tisochrysis_lutea.AAC.4